MQSFRNIAGYKFAPLSRLKELRARLIALCKEWRLKGTILLSEEGINLFVAGSEPDIDKLLLELRTIPGLEELEVKISESHGQPFNRMLVRIKKEIIAFGVAGIDPARNPSPKLSPKTLKQWLDEGRPVTLLDTRNDYEVKLGTFQNAVPIGIKHFRDFPNAVGHLPAEMKEQPIVMFCTGGIRCEKAGPFMAREGFKNIFQLEGGILKYFEECGGDHYNGECFVFDQRVGLDPHLDETDSTQCFQCLTPLTKQEQEDPRYIAGKSCPYCFKTSEQQLAENLARRQESFNQAVNPLPGSQPYNNFRPITVPVECDGTTLLDFLNQTLPHIPQTEWLSLIEKKLLLDPNHDCVTPDKIVHTGERYFQKIPDLVEPDVNGAIKVLHEDEALVVLDKPAPLPMHPSGRFNRNTLQYILQQVYYPQKPRPAHRLDANTTGLVLVTRARHFASKLQPQFARGEVKKTYLARIHGHPSANNFTCDAPISVEPGVTGSRTVDFENGLPSVTHFTVLNRLKDGTSLLEAKPISGRTNQIRLHLQQLGHPVCGDPIYSHESRETQTLTPNDPPLCLHAWKMEFRHPMTGSNVSFTSAAPSWAQENNPSNQNV